MPSAIELYRDAYDLDYRRGDWQSAEEMYQRIVEQYPYSSEKEYALVHLERLKKLKEDPDNQELQPVRAKGGPGPLSVINFLLVLVLVAATVTGAWFLFQHDDQLAYYDIVIGGMLSEKSGDVDAAAALFQKAQGLLPGQSLAYRCLAELYLDRKNLKLAEIEGKRWAVAAPDDPMLARFRERMRQTPNSPEAPK